MEVGGFNVDAVLRTIKTRKAANQAEAFWYGSTIRTAENTNASIKSPSIKVKVLPLPKEGKPLSFNGLTGKFTIESQLDKTQVDANDAINLKIIVSGTGLVVTGINIATYHQG